MTAFRLGGAVEVTDPSSRFYRRTGTITLVVGDNMYVRFPHARWFATRVFFPEQLRAANAPAVPPGPSAARDPAQTKPAG